MLRRSYRHILLWLFGRRSRFMVSGDSMLPTLRDGDSILIEHGFYLNHSPNIGDLVLAEHPHRKGFLIVKRIIDIQPEGVVIQGDNPSQSIDSRDYGPIPQKNLLARVWSRL